MKYNTFTLSPCDEQESELFKDFRLKDVHEQFKLLCYLYVFISVVQIIMCCLTREIITVVDTGTVIVIAALLLLVYKLPLLKQKHRLQIAIVASVWVCNLLYFLSFALLTLPSVADPTDKKISLE